MWQGTLLLGGVVLGCQMSSEEQQAGVISQVLRGFRVCGLDATQFSDRMLIEDYIRKNTSAAVNVLMASPTFYFFFAKIHGQSLVVSSIRAITGTLRIVPFMGLFYGFFALVSPFVTSAFMARGQSYQDAQTNAGIAVMLSGLAAIEALVELRGCGVTFGQMAPSAFLIFIPALIGRLATGVLTQQQKVGTTETVSLLPPSWEHGPAWQQRTYLLFDQLALDREFLITCAGTTVFQHVLNSITWVLLTRGKTSTFVDIARFCFGGLGGTPLSGVRQFGKTFVMRLGFSWVWNWCTTQQFPMPAFDSALKTCS